MKVSFGKLTCNRHSKIPMVGDSVIDKEGKTFKITKSTRICANIFMVFSNRRTFLVYVDIPKANTREFPWTIGFKAQAFINKGKPANITIFDQESHKRRTITTKPVREIRALKNDKRLLIVSTISGSTYVLML